MTLYPWVVSTLLCLGLLTYPDRQPAADVMPLRMMPACYILTLKRGGQLVTTHYWRQGHQILFEVEEGVMGVAESAVRDIRAVDSARAATGLCATTPVAPSATATAKPAAEALSSNDLAGYHTQKEALQAQIDAAMERYRQASTAHDAAEKARLQQEITVWSKQLSELIEIVKQKHQGRLPDGWDMP